jgi:DNA-binding transcriptional regulator YiaG
MNNTDLMKNARASMNEHFELNKKIAEVKMLLVDKLRQKLENSDDLSIEEIKEIREMLKDLSLTITP